MFKVECCKVKRKADVYILAVNKKEDYKVLKTLRCPVCKKVIALLEKKMYDGKITFVRFEGKKAEEFIDRQFCNILYELKPLSASKSSMFYLNYSEYGKIKKCYSNLSSLKLGRIKDNFDDVKQKKICL